MSKLWKTGITSVAANRILIRGYPVQDLARKRSFGDIVFLLVTGELPQRREGELIEAILVCCCDHGLLAPSTDAVRFVASCGVPLQAAVAAGVCAIGDDHGGAIEPLARLLDNAAAGKLDLKRHLADLKRSGRRMPGFGHPVHTKDPRAKVLLKLADQWGLSGVHVRLARDLESATESIIGRRLPLNVDGVIAALMMDMGISPIYGKAFFIVSRAAGYVAHACEQQLYEKPFKELPLDEITYTGPSYRRVPNRPKPRPGAGGPDQKVKTSIGRKGK
jgi:citrate synthase